MLYSPSMLKGAAFAFSPLLRNMNLAHPTVYSPALHCSPKQLVVIPSGLTMRPVWSNQLVMAIGNWNLGGASPRLTLVTPRQAGGGLASLAGSAENSGEMDHSAGRDRMGSGSSVY